MEREPCPAEQEKAKPETTGEKIHLDRREIPFVIAHIHDQEDELEREERAL